MSRIANRRLIKPSDPDRFSDLGQVIVAIILLVIPAFLFAAQRAELHEAQRELTRLERRLVDLEERRQHLLLERATELDPRRVQEKARRISGLTDPDAEQVVFLGRPGTQSPSPLLAAGAIGEPDGHP